MQVLNAKVSIVPQFLPFHRRTSAVWPITHKHKPETGVSHCGANNIAIHIIIRTRFKRRWRSLATLLWCYVGSALQVLV